MRRRLKSLFKIAISFVTIGAIMVILCLLLGGAGELSREVTDLVHMIRVGVSESVERIPLLERITNISGFTVDIDELTVEINEEYETITGDYRNLVLAEASEVSNLDVSIFSGSCRILPSENGCFGVESSGVKEFQCYVSDGTLYLSVLPETISQSGDAEIILYVPNEQQYNKVFMFCSAEAVTVEANLLGNSLNLSSVCGSNIVSGKTDFENVTFTAGIGSLSVGTVVAGKLKLEVGSAEVHVEEMLARTVEVNLGMGSLSLNGITEEDIVLNCGVGHLEMMLLCGQDTYNYDISGSAESVQIGTDTLAGMVMERWIDNGSDKKITMSCAMGSVKIEFEK